MIARRTRGIPLEHILGWAEFCGLSVSVGPGVFVPRRRSEFLARQAIELARTRSTPIVVDLCCGSGAIAMVLCSALETVALYATDIDPVAVQFARENLGTRAQVVQGDLYDALPGHLRGRVDVVVANGPYVPTGAIGLLPAEARVHEPSIALDGGTDGLDMHRRLAVGAHKWLAPGGSLIVETSEGQALRTADIFALKRLAPRCVVSADDNDATVVIGTALRPDPGNEDDNLRLNT